MTTRKNHKWTDSDRSALRGVVDKLTTRERELADQGHRPGTKGSFFHAVASVLSMNHDIHVTGSAAQAQHDYMSGGAEQRKKDREEMAEIRQRRHLSEQMGLIHPSLADPSPGPDFQSYTLGLFRDISKTAKTQLDSIHELSEWLKTLSERVTLTNLRIDALDQGVLPPSGDLLEVPDERH